MNTFFTGLENLERFLFRDARSAWLWLFVRLWLGYEWLHAGFEKLMNPKWVGSEAGMAIGGFFRGVLAKAAADTPHPDVQWWYAEFIEHVAAPNATFFSYLITYGEIAAGLGLICGVFATAATAGGLLMNFSFLLAGTVSINPIMVLFGFPLLLAHRVSWRFGLEGWYREYRNNMEPGQRMAEEKSP